MQGDVREHLAVLDRLDASALGVKRADELASVDALILPGGESTTIGKLLDRFDLLEDLKERIDDGLPVFGTCAGLILMAREVVGDQDVPFRLGVLDVSVRRNAYGRQVDSFEANIGDLRGAFIRAPIVESVGPGVEVIAEHEGSPALVREGALLAATFHPEIAGEDRVHAMFLEMVAGN